MFEVARRLVTESVFKYFEGMSCCLGREKGSERYDQLSQIMDTRLESIEFSPQTGNPDHFSKRSARRLQLPGGQRHGIINVGEFERVEIEFERVEIEFERVEIEFERVEIECMR
jgi:hypothetical protein